VNKFLVCLVEDFIANSSPSAQLLRHKGKMKWSVGAVSQQQPTAPAQGPLVNATDVVASGLAGVTVATLSSKLGVEGTLLGVGIASMAGTASSSIYKGYLNMATTSGQRLPIVLRLLAAWRWFASERPRERRSILRSGLLAGLVACLLGVAAITFFEVSVDKSFSCLIWQECPANTNQSTQPSILGGNAQYGDADGDGVPDEEEAF